MKRRDLMHALIAAPIAYKLSPHTGDGPQKQEIEGFYDELVWEPTNSEMYTTALVAGTEIVRRIMRNSAPVGTHFKGFQFTMNGSQVNPQSIWASGVTSDHRLIHMRPHYFDGWRERGTPRVVSS